MKKVGILGVLISISISTSFARATSETDWTGIQARCLRPLVDEAVVYQNDFRWNITPVEMQTKYDEIYQSGKRLKGRVFFDPERRTFIAPGHLDGNEIPMDPLFIKSTILQVERALALRYADFIFFPDMGHNHFYIPENRWNLFYRPLTTRTGFILDDIYFHLFSDPELWALYHTAEQLQLTDESRRVLPSPYLQRRYWTRNIAGDNSGQGIIDMYFSPDGEFNTVRNLPGFESWSSGVNLSASKDGCFPFVHLGEVYYFDISLHDLPRQSTNNDTW